MNKVMMVTSVLLIKEGNPESLRKKKALWDYLRNYDLALYAAIKNNSISRTVNLPGQMGRKIVKAGYQLSRKIYGFNEPYARKCYKTDSCKTLPDHERTK